MTVRHLLAAVATSALILGAAACQPQQTAETTEPAAVETPAEPVAPAPADVVATAQGNPDFSTLVAAVTAAELADDLQAATAVTVFAPNNAAFSAIQAQVDELLKPENKDQLVRVLQHHVVASEILSSAIATGKTEVDTLAGTKLAVEKAADGTVTVGGAKVVQADVDASNGVIHVVDTVILPPAQ